MDRDGRVPPETMPRPPPRPPIPDEDLFAPGTTVDHYRIQRRIGRGGMGEVYLARDGQLGRRAAIKALRPETLGSREAVDRFLHEARTTARFSHPHIVTVYHVGERQGCPYVALEYLEGRNLRDRLDEGDVGVAETIRTGLAVAEALVEAHRHHVLHRDLKPENVMLPRDGRLRVVDFGLAKALETSPVDSLELEGGVPLPPRGPAETQAERAHGSPGYMAPEQWLEETTTPAVDVWALGVVLYEMLHGRHPYEGITDLMQLCHAVTCDAPAPAVTASAPDRLVDLIGRCLDKDPVGRPSARECAEVLRALLVPRRGPDGTDVPPFRGLLPFRERHAAQFHGRDAELDAFLERIREQPVLPVVGPSGAGKSSFVQAGVIPRLREQGRWLVLRLRPGRTPMRALAARLVQPTIGDTTSQPTLEDPRAEAGADEETGATGELERRIGLEEDLLHDDLRESPKRLALRLAELAEREAPSRVLLFVDQLEELFTLVDDDALRRVWLDAICAAADDPDGPVRVIFTVRDDFLGRLTESAAAQDALSHVTVLGVPGGDALRATLEQPVRDAGYTFDDPAMLDEMVAAVEGEPAALPLLQFTAEMLWRRRDREGRRLRRADLEALGGVAGALAGHADGVLRGLSESQRRTARDLLLRLVHPDGTRRVLPYRELPRRRLEEVALVLDRLIQARLVLVREGRRAGPTHSGHPTAEFELVHESLIQRWDQLARWIDESREEHAYLSELTQAAALWSRRGRRPEELWQGDALHDALRTRARLDIDLPDAVQAFLDGAESQERQRARRARRTVAIVVAACVAVALLTTVLALVARHDRARAVELQHRAELRRAEAQLEGSRAAWTRGDVLEARAKLRESLETVDSTLARGLWWQLSHDPLRWHAHLGATVYSLAVAPDGGRVAAGLQDGTVQLIDPVTCRTHPLRGLHSAAQAVAFSPDGRRLAVGTYGGTLAIWDLSGDGAPIQIEGAHDAYVSVVRFAPGGGLLATASRDGTVGLWDPASGQRVRTLDVGDGRVHDVRFSSTGAWLATGDQRGGVALWDPATGERLLALDGHTRAAHRVVFSPDGSWLASGSWDGTARLWDLPGGTPRATLRGHESRITEIVAHPDGQRLYTSGNDGTLREWSVRDGRELRVLRGHRDRVSGVRVSPDGTALASRSDDHTVRLWDLAGDGGGDRVLGVHEASIMVLEYAPDGALLYSGGNDDEVHAWATGVAPADPPHRGHEAMVTGLAVAPGGEVAASASLDRTVVLWSLPSGRPQATLRGQQDGQLGVAFAPDGATVAAAGIDGTIRVWDTSTGAERWVLEGHAGPIHELAYRGDGGVLISAGGDHTVRTWDLATGEPLQVSRDHDHYLTALTLSPDGRRLATGANDGRIAVWDAARGRVQRQWTSPAGHVWGLRFTPDGQRLVSGGDDQTLRVWDASLGEERLAAPLDGRIHMLDVDPRRGRIGAPCSDGRAYLLDARGTVEVVLHGHRGTVNALRFAGDRVVTAGDDGTVRAWDAASGHPLWHAAALLPDPPELWTHAGWIAASQPSPAAGETPAWRGAIEDRARQAAASAGRARLCLLDHDGALEIWDPAADRRLARTEVGAVRQLAATAEACVVLGEDGVVQLVHPEQPAAALARDATALALADGEILVATPGEALRLDAGGAELERLEADIDATAVGRADGRVVVGYREGAVEVFAPKGYALHSSKRPRSRLDGSVWSCRLPRSRIGLRAPGWRL